MCACVGVMMMWPSMCDSFFLSEVARVVGKVRVRREIAERARLVSNVEISLRVHVACAALHQNVCTYGESLYIHSAVCRISLRSFLVRFAAFV